MELRVRRSGPVLIARASGKAVGEESLRLKRFFEELLARIPDGEAPFLVLNLRELSFLDSQGLGAVVAAQQAITKRGGKMAISDPTPNVHRLLTVAKLTTILPVYADDETAVAALSGRAAKATSL